MYWIHLWVYNEHNWGICMLMGIGIQSIAKPLWYIKDVTQLAVLACSTSIPQTRLYKFTKTNYILGTFNNINLVVLHDSLWTKSRLTIMHNHTKFCYTWLSGSKNIFWTTSFTRTDGHRHGDSRIPPGTHTSIGHQSMDQHVFKTSETFFSNLHGIQTVFGRVRQDRQDP